MPRPQRKTYADRANELLEESQRNGVEPDLAGILRQEASILATLAVAEAVDRARDEIGSVADALKDQDGYGVGGHLRNVGDWVEKIAKDR